MEPSKERFEQYLQSCGGRLGSAIHDLWESRDVSAWAKDPWFFLRLGEVAADLGQSMFAHDVLGEGLRVFPGHVRLTQRFSLQLIACGFLLTARELLTNLMNDGHFDEETLGILGRVYKEMWLIEGEGAADHPHLVRSRELYVGAFRRSRGSYSGINAASLSLIMGDRDLSERLAREVIRICLEAWKDPARRDYWLLATLAEGFLLLGRQDKAQKYCGYARDRADRTWASLASTRRQFALLGRYTDVDAAVLDVLRIPPVVAFSGHRVDAPGQRPAHFPAEAAEAVKGQIAAVLERLGARIGYASAARGGDVLFHECLQERGGESNVILPFARDEFLKTSVEGAGDEWTRRAVQVMDRCTMVEQATPGLYRGEDLLFSYANRLIVGKTILRSRFLETQPLLMAVWDGARNGKPGGTAECVSLWETTGFPAILIDPVTAQVTEPRGAPYQVTGGAARANRGAASGAPGGTRGTRGTRGTGAHQRMMSIVFADLVGFSRLGEEQVPAYVSGFLAELARTVRRGARPRYRNTWGDAMCLVFEDALRAAECAIRMRDLVRHTDWERRGLPRGLSMRVGLHAGPVFPFREPLMERQNFLGFHMNQAARIEPVTRPGNVYASEAFASVLLADRRNTFDCRYVGVIVLPKDFGSYPIYHLKRKTEVG